MTETTTTASAPSLADFSEAPPEAPHHAYAGKVLQALAGCPLWVALDVTLSLYRHLVLTNPHQACTATAAFDTAVLSQELAAAAGVTATPPTVN